VLFGKEVRSDDFRRDTFSTRYPHHLLGKTSQHERSECRR